MNTSTLAELLLSIRFTLLTVQIFRETQFKNFHREPNSRVARNPIQCSANDVARDATGSKQKYAIKFQSRLIISKSAETRSQIERIEFNKTVDDSFTLSTVLLIVFFSLLSLQSRRFGSSVRWLNS